MDMKEMYELANTLRNMQNNRDYGVMYKEYTKQLVELLVGNEEKESSEMPND